MLTAKGLEVQMRLFRATVAAALVAVVSGASPLLAESAGWVSGHAIDAANRPLPNLRVELLKAFRGQPVGVPQQAQVTDGRGAWTFNGVPVGDYVVRMVYHDRATGVPVSVTAGSETPSVLLVAPSLLPPAQLSQGQGGAAAAAGGGGGGFSALTVASTALVAASAIAVVVALRDDKS